MRSANLKMIVQMSLVCFSLFAESYSRGSEGVWIRRSLVMIGRWLRRTGNTITGTEHVFEAVLLSLFSTTDVYNSASPSR